MATKEKDEKKRALEYFRNLSEELEKIDEMLRLVVQSRGRHINDNETYTGREVEDIVETAVHIVLGKQFFDIIQETIDKIIDLLDDDSDE